MIYRAFGLNLRSCLPLPELPFAEPEAQVDAEIIYGAVPESLPDAAVRAVRREAAQGRILVTVDGIARYLISDGSRVTIQREPSADDDDVRTFLFVPALGGLLQQRGDLVFNGSAVERNGEAVVFLGSGCMGKSTLAAALARHGWRVLTDDLCVLRGEAGGPFCVEPGFPAVWLWPDSLIHLDIEPAQLRRIRRNLDKRSLPIEGRFAPLRTRVRQLYVVAEGRGVAPSLITVDGPRRFNLIRSYAFVAGSPASAPDQEKHFKLAMQLAAVAKVGMLTRPRGPVDTAPLIKLIESDLGGV